MSAQNIVLARVDRDRCVLLFVCVFGSCATAASSFAGVRASSVTSAPSRASSIAAARPIPCEPPQTSACLPVRSRFMVSPRGSASSVARRQFLIICGSSSSSLSPCGGSTSSRSNPSWARRRRRGRRRHGIPHRAGRYARVLVVVAQGFAVGIEDFGDAAVGTRSRAHISVSPTGAIHHCAPSSSLIACLRESPEPLIPRNLPYPQQWPTRRMCRGTRAH